MEGVDQESREWSLRNPEDLVLNPVPVSVRDSRIPGFFNVITYIIANRMSVLNKLVNLDWLNLSLISFKLKVKELFLTN